MILIGMDDHSLHRHSGSDNCRRRGVALAGDGDCG